MQNDASKRMRVRFVVLKVLLHIALYCIFIFIRSLTDGSGSRATPTAS